MKIYDLPTDIWHRIVRIGIEDLQILNISDILNLSAVNRLLYGLLQDNAIWYHIFRWYYFDLLHEYGITDLICDDLQVTAKYTSDISYFDRTMFYYDKEILFRNCIQKYKPRDEVYNIAYFLDKFTDDFDYIPIIKNYVENERRSQHISDNEHWTFDITRRSLACNLINAYNFKLGINFFGKFIKDSIHPTPSLFEGFWLKTNLFDKAYPEMVFHRRTKLNEVYKLLYKEINLHILLHKSWGNKVLLKQTTETSKSTIVMIDNKTFGKFMWHILRLILSVFGRNCTFYSPNESLEYMENYCLEDFSILRLYREEVKGHPILLYSILMKILDETIFSKYDFQIGEIGVASTVAMKMTSAFLIIGDHYFLIPKDATSFYTIEHYTFQQVIRYLRSEFNLSTFAQISRYMKPLDLKDMLTYFLNLDTKYGAKSIYSLSHPESKLLSSNPLITSEKFLVGYKLEEYQFAKFVCSFLQNDYNEKGLTKFMLCSEFEKYFNQSNNFIYFRALIDAIQLEPSKIKMITDYFKLNLSDRSKIFQNNFDLLNPINSKIAFGRICPKLDGSNTTNCDGKNFDKGMLVYHTKFNSLGVIINIINRNGSGSNVSYCKVYTSQGYVETYSALSLRKIANCVTNMAGPITNCFLDICGIDVFGLLHCSSFKNGIESPQFNQID